MRRGSCESCGGITAGRGPSGCCSIARVRTPRGRRNAFAAAQGITLVWLPKQAPEFSAMDQLWRELKRVVAGQSPGNECRCPRDQRDVVGCSFNAVSGASQVGPISPHFRLCDL
jgi:hypothetical protein